MILIVKVMILLIALEHLFILWIEMFAWQSKGSMFFADAESEFLQKTKVMAANQGLYNGFLAAGLIWSTAITTSFWAYSIATFFLSCVIVAGVYGALTAAKMIFFKQALPAIIVLISILTIQLL